MNNLQNVSDYSINKVYGTIATGVFCTTLLVLGNSSTIVNFNETHTDQQVVYESQKNTIFKTFTSQISISYELPGYTFNNMMPYVERISMDNEKVSNLEKLEQIAKLEDGWDGDNAKAFNDTLITNVRSILMGLRIQPELFPTACDTIQIEYEREDGAYLEIEIAEDRNAKVFAIDSKGSESSSVINASVQEIGKVVDSFYG